MNPLLLNLSQPQGIPLGTTHNGILTTQSQDNPTFGNSLQELNASILARARRARQMGMSENDIQLNIAQDLADQGDRRAQLLGAPSGFTQSNQAQAHKGNFLTHLLPTIGGTGGAVGGAMAGAALGSVVPIIGTGIGGILGGVIGGALGSAGAKAGENKLEGRNWKDELGSQAVYGGLGGLLPGAGKIGEGLLVRGGENLAERGAAEATANAAERTAGNAVKGGIEALGDTSGMTRAARMGTELRADARGLEQAGKLFPMENDRIAASQIMDAAGLKGSARNQFRNLPEVITNLNKRATEVLGQSTEKGNVLDIAQRFTQDAGSHTEATNPTFQKSLSRLTDALFQRADQKTGEISAQELYNFKQDLADRLGSAWKKLDAGTSLSPSEEAYMEVWKKIDNEITTLAPQAKNLTRAQSILLQSAPVLDKAANPSTKLFNMIPVKAPTQMLQTAQSGAGRAMQLFGRAGNAAEMGGMAEVAADAGGQAAGMTMRKAVTKAGVRQFVPRLLTGGLGDNGAPGGDQSANAAALNMFGSEQDAADFQKQLEDAGVDTGGLASAFMGGQAGAGSVTHDANGNPVHAGSGQAWDAVNGTGQLPRDAIQKALAQDLATTGGKNMAQILEFADYTNQTGKYAPTQKGVLDTNTQKSLVGLSSANNTIDQIEQLYQQAGGGRGKAGGTVASLLGKVTGSPADTYNQQVGGMAAQISRALGNTGAMSDQDVARAVGLLPKVTDTPAQASAKLNALRQLIQANAQSIMQTAQYGSSGAGAGLSEADLAGVGA